MMLYKNTYRIASARLKGWDYRSNGFYFITICTYDRQHFFGEVVNGEMQLSAIGEIVAQEWIKTPQIRPYVIPDEWVVMPNHFHGIVAINNGFSADVQTFRRNVSTHPTCRNVSIHPTRRNVSIHPPLIRSRSPSHSKKFINPHPSISPYIRRSPPKIFKPASPSVQTTQQHTHNATGLKSKSLGAIIGQFKSVCTKQIWQLGYSDFRWQSRFYDHIIRDEIALHRIRQYIADNPQKWHQDRENTANLYM